MFRLGSSSSALIAGAAVGLAFLVAEPAGAVTLTADTALTTQQQTTNSPCIFGDPSCKQPASFPAVTDLPSSGDFSGFTDSTYNVGALRTLLGGDTFYVGIDVSYNSSFGHNLNEFYMQKVGGAILADYNPADPGPALAPNFNPGNGYSDFTLGSFSLAGLLNTDSVIFFLNMTNFNDGPDEFFLLASAQAVPLPAALPLFGGALLGSGVLGWWKRRRAASAGLPTVVQA
jgi:hypothetical protein